MSIRRDLAYITRISIRCFEATHTRARVYGTNVKISLILLSMIISRRRQKERTFDESTRAISASMTEGGSSLLLLKSAIYSGYPGSIRSLKERRIFAYTKESLPYFVEHCAPRLFDRDVLCDLRLRSGAGAGFPLARSEDIAPWIYLGRNSPARARALYILAGLNPGARHAISRDKGIRYAREIHPCPLTL